MCRETRCLVCVGVGRSDGRHHGHHKANPLFHAITKISRILGTLAMLMMSINEIVKETQYHNSILKSSQKHPSDQVVKEMISLWHFVVLPNYHEDEAVFREALGNLVRSRSAEKNVHIVLVIGGLPEPDHFGLSQMVACPLVVSGVELDSSRF